MKRMLMAVGVVCLMSSLALAGDKTPPPKWGGDNEAKAEKQEENARKTRMLAVVGIAEALELSEADALKLSDKLRVVDEKRRPIREAMNDAVRSLKAAAEGGTATDAQVTQDIQRVLDGRVQLAALDKEMFAELSQGQSPQKKAKLALFLAKFGEETRRMKAMSKGRALPDGR